MVLLNLVLKLVDQPDRHSRTTRFGQECIQLIRAHQHRSHQDTLVDLESDEIL